MNVGENIKKRRKELGLSAETLAERVKVSASTIYRYESGQIEKVGTDKLLLIADALFTTPQKLMGYDDSKTGVSAPNHAKTISHSGANFAHNLNRAASAAVETLIHYNITSAPIDPLHILKCLPGVFVATFTEMADADGLDNNTLVTEFGGSSQDAVTINVDTSIHLRVVAYNQRMPFYMLQMALARELGHIVLDHDGPAHTETEIAEALHFARHLLCPRPLIHAIQAAGVRLTVEGVGNITGCYGRCLAGIRKTDGAHVPADKNRQLRARFADYIARFLAYQAVMSRSDDSAPADFGTYMDNYKE